MRFVSLKVDNFRGLQDIWLPLSDFGCLIGENNSGKSSALQALLMLLPGSGQKPTVNDFYDRRAAIRIALRIEGITASDLDRLSDSHRQSVANDIVDSALTLVRVISLDEGAIQSNLKVERLGPANEAWLVENLQPLMTNKKDADLRAAVVGAIPELDPVLPARPSQTVVKEKLAELIAALPPTELIARDGPLGTGIENALKGFLPEPIYIEAVKDVADEVKTSDSATFGKLLGILLDEVQDEFGDMEERFRVIQRQLSRVTDAATGESSDNRLPEIQRVEELINGFVRESFPDVDVTIDVPVPKMKTILAGATLAADDGHDGPVVSKGDGLKRAVAFAILRAYTTLRGRGINADRQPAAGPRYWLLFEEPELYLHPRAQRQLFRALEVFARENLVLVATHSPLFFDADTTRSFVKFRKTQPESGAAPCTEITPITMSDLPLKTAFQIICHENNNIGFFARKVVLVEGDSDAIILGHLARVFGSKAWDLVEQNIAVARTGGKGNIASYRLFFEKFGIPVHVIADLDVLLNGFDKLGPSEEMTALRGELLGELDKVIGAVPDTELTETKAKAIRDSGNARALWAAAETARQELDGTEETAAALARAVDEFFAYKRKDERLRTLAQGGGEVETVKSELLALLAEAKVHVLSLGSIESYYGSGESSADKVRHAIEYVATCPDVESYRRDLGTASTKAESDLRAIFSAIFDEGTSS